MSVHTSQFRPPHLAVLLGVVAIVVTACGSTNPAAQGTESDAVAAARADAVSWTDSEPVDLPSDQGFVTDEKSAYAFARPYAAALPGAGDRYGFKFGCGSASLCPFQERVPLFGVLWQAMQQDTGAVIDRSTYVRGFVEGELAFRFTSPVAAPTDSVAAVKEAATEVAPAVELPDFAFGGRPLDTTPNIDVAALNGIARNLVVGEFKPTSTVPVEQVRMTGTRDGRRVLGGSAEDVTDGSHWRALQLAIELIVGQGYTIDAGDVIITGTMGEPTPLDPGTYRVRFSKGLGKVAFTAGG